MLNTAADRAAVWIDPLIFGIGVKEGEAGEEKKIQDQPDGDQQRRRVSFDYSGRHGVRITDGTHQT